MKKYASHIVVGLVCLVVGALGAKAFMPPEVVTVDREIHHEKQETTIRQDVNLQELEKLIASIMKKNNISTNKETIIKEPGGKETIIKESSVDLSETNTKIDSQKSSITDIKQDLRLLREELKIDEHIKIVSQPKPNWSLDLQVGYYVPALWGRDPDINIVPMRGLVGGLSLNRRLFGDVWFGLWLNTMGAGGGQLRYQWR